MPPLIQSSPQTPTRQTFWAILISTVQEDQIFAAVIEGASPAAIGCEMPQTDWEKVAERRLGTAENTLYLLLFIRIM